MEEKNEEGELYLTISKKRRIRACLARALASAEEHYLVMAGVAVRRWKQFVLQELEKIAFQERKREESGRIGKLVELLRESPIESRTDDELTAIMDFLKLLAFPPACDFSIEDVRLTKICRWVDLKEMDDFSVFFYEGQRKSHPVFTILSGEVHLVRLPMAVGDTDADHMIVEEQLRSMPLEDRALMLGEPLERLGPGELFGDKQALGGGKDQTALCHGPCQLLVIARSLFRSTCVMQDQLTQQFLQEINWCRSFTDQEVAALASDLQRVSFPARAAVAVVGDPLNYLYLLEKGDVTVAAERELRSGGSQITVDICHLTSGSIIGDLEVYSEEESFRYHYIANTDTHTYKMPIEKYKEHFLDKEDMTIYIEDSVNSRNSLYAKKIKDKVARFKSHRRSTGLGEKLDILKYGTLQRRKAIVTVDVLPSISPDRESLRRTLRRSQSMFDETPNRKGSGLNGSARSPLPSSRSARSRNNTSGRGRSCRASSLTSDDGSESEMSQQSRSASPSSRSTLTKLEVLPALSPKSEGVISSRSSVAKSEYNISARKSSHMLAENIDSTRKKKNQENEEDPLSPKIVHKASSWSEKSHRNEEPKAVAASDGHSIEESSRRSSGLGGWALAEYDRRCQDQDSLNGEDLSDNSSFTKIRARPAPVSGDGNTS